MAKESYRQIINDRYLVEVAWTSCQGALKEFVVGFYFKHPKLMIARFDNLTGVEFLMTWFIWTCSIKLETCAQRFHLQQFLSDKLLTMPKTTLKPTRKPLKRNSSSGVKVAPIRRWLLKSGFRKLTPTEMEHSELVAALK